MKIAAFFGRYKRMTELRPNEINKYRAQWEFTRGVAEVVTTPVFLQMARSNKCNFKCVYCIEQRPGNTFPRTELTGATWERLLRLIPVSDTLAFHGISEFMMDPEFFDIVSRCAAAKATLSINTNGSVCTPKYVKALVEYPAPLQINFSIDAATAETFERIRGWRFDRVVRNVETYVRSFKSRTNRTWTSLSFVIAKSNVQEMQGFVRLAKQLDVESIKFYRMHEYEELNWRVDAKRGGEFDYREEVVSTFAAEYNEQVARTRALADELGVEAELPALAEPEELMAAAE
jgi:MoaA/NifB/PqqE/SkfB family radical SAM enzyme